MAARSKTKKKRKVKENKELSRRIRLLEAIVKYSKRAIIKNGADDLNQLFTNQVMKAEAELDKLKENQ